MQPAYTPDRYVPNDTPVQQIQEAHPSPRTRNHFHRHHHHYVHNSNPPAPNTCVVLKNLDYKITQQELEEVVRRVAGGRKEFINLSLIDDKTTGQFRGMAFVNFHTVEDAAAALTALSKMKINDRKVIAEYRRLRPGEKEKRQAADDRRRLIAQAQHSRTTFEKDVDANAVDADGNTLDKRRAFFNTRDRVMKAFETSRAAEKADRDREREAIFRARLVEYKELDVPDGEEIEDIKFESDLTSYERRMIHVICDEMGLGHMSVLGEDGVRVLCVTKHPERTKEWEEATAEIRKAATERKDEEKRRRKEEREAARIAAANLPNGTDWKKNGDMSTAGGPPTKEELEGIKWFKPRSAIMADGQHVTVTNAIKKPAVKLYTPERQPIGPDGTIGFTRRLKESGVADKLKTRMVNLENSETTDEGQIGSTGGVDNGNDANGDVAAAAAKHIVRSKPIGSATASTTILNPTVPAFTPTTFAT